MGDTFLQMIPILKQLVLFVGTCRLIFKPIFSVIEGVVMVTPTKKDDELLNRAESSAWWKAFSYFVNLTTSIKVK